MSKTVRVIAQVNGAAELNAALRQLPAALGERVIMAGLKGAVGPVVRDARRMAPTHNGRLRRSIRAVQAGAFQGGGRARRFVKKGFTIVVKPFAPHAHLVEFGTAPRTTRGGAFRGATRAMPFLRPAWLLNEAKVRADLTKHFWDALLKEGRRLHLKLKRKAG